MLGPVPVIKEPRPVMQLRGIAAFAMSYAVLTANEVAAVEEEVLFTASESNTAPQVAVVAAAMLTTGFAPAVTPIGAVPVTEATEVPLDADTIRPYPSTLMVGFV